MLTTIMVNSKYDVVYMVRCMVIYSTLSLRLTRPCVVEYFDMQMISLGIYSVVKHFF